MRVVGRMKADRQRLRGKRDKKRKGNRQKEREKERG